MAKEDCPECGERYRWYGEEYKVGTGGAPIVTRRDYQCHNGHRWEAEADLISRHEPYVKAIGDTWQFTIGANEAPMLSDAACDECLCEPPDHDDNCVTGLKARIADLEKRRCGSCRHWGDGAYWHEPRDGYRYCVGMQSVGVDGDCPAIRIGEVETTTDFGCLLWQPRAQT